MSLKSIELISDRYLLLLTLITRAPIIFRILLRKQKYMLVICAILAHMSIQK